MSLQRVHWLSLLLLVLNIVAVTTIFKLIPDRQVAGYVAGALFVGMGLWVLLTEISMGRFVRSFGLWSAVIFLALSALPILGLRIFNPGIAFDELSFLGMNGPQLHKLSNWTFMAMIAATLIELVRDYRKSP